MRAEEALSRIGEDRPLVHHITNYVTANLSANATLCTGALPVMAHAREEVVEMVSAASALVINIGTLDANSIESMLLAGRQANTLGKPVILDPVGAGATALRTQTSERILTELKVSAVCGNAGEVATLAGLAAEVRGVESLAGDARSAAEEAARTLGVTVAATGETDYVGDGDRTLAVGNGHPLMGRMVGSGCASTSVVGCFAAVGGGGVETVAAALAYFGRAGELAAEKAGGPGTFETLLLDALAVLSDDSSGLDGAVGIEELVRG